MRHTTPSASRLSLQILAVCAIVTVVGGSLILIERLQGRLAAAERRNVMIQERVAAMKAMMEVREREWKKQAGKSKNRSDGAADVVRIGSPNPEGR